MRILAITIVLTLMASYGTAQTADAETKRELVGVWQNSRGVASGLTDNYQFFEDGRFRFNYNEMDGTNRVLSFSGFWNVYKQKLHLHANRITVLIGGKWIKSTGSIATEYEIAGGNVISKQITPVEKLSYTMSEFELEEQTYKTILIGDVKYRKLSSDPRGFEN